MAIFNDPTGFNNGKSPENTFNSNNSDHNSNDRSSGNANPNNYPRSNFSDRPYNSNNTGYQKFNRNSKQDDDGPTELYKPYVGSGNLEAPPLILEKIKRIAKLLDENGYTCRVGGFLGPEEAFEKNAKRQELHLPWKNFNDKESKLTFTNKKAFDIARMFHPSYDSLKPAIQTIVAKNVRLIMGKNIDSPCLFAIVWSQDGIEHGKDKTSSTGNIGHLISIASAVRIPVFNLARPDTEQRIYNFLELTPKDPNNG